MLWVHSINLFHVQEKSINEKAKLFNFWVWKQRSCLGYIWKRAVVCRCMREQLRQLVTFPSPKLDERNWIMAWIIRENEKKFSELLVGPLAYATMSHTGCGFPTMSKLWSHQFSCTESRCYCNSQNHITTYIDICSILQYLLWLWFTILWYIKYINGYLFSRTYIEQSPKSSPIMKWLQRDYCSARTSKNLTHNTQVGG